MITSSVPWPHAPPLRLSKKGTYIVTYDSYDSYEKSWIARLKYVHHNPLHHSIVQNTQLYEWCSAAWFARESSNAFVKTVNSFKIDPVKVFDDFGVRRLDGALKQSGSTPDESAPPSKNTITRSESENLRDNLAHSENPPTQSKSGVELLRKPPAHRTPPPKN